MKTEISPVIRHTKSSDLRSIVTLLTDDELGKTRELLSLNDKEVAECYLNAYNAMLENSYQRLIVMEIGSEIVGVLELTFIPSLTRQGSLRANVEGVRVKSNWRGQGLGKKLFEYVKQVAQDKGCKLIQLTTDNQRIHAKRFYESLGFVSSHIGMKMEI